MASINVYRQILSNYMRSTGEASVPGNLTVDMPDAAVVARVEQIKQQQPAWFATQMQMLPQFGEGATVTGTGPNATLSWTEPPKGEDLDALAFLGGAYSVSNIGNWLAGGGLGNFIDSAKNFVSGAGSDPTWGVNPQGGNPYGAVDGYDPGVWDDIDTIGGKATLQNNGFKDYDSFIQSLTSAGATAQAATTAAKAVAAGSALDTALKLAGIAAPIGAALLGKSAITDAAKAQTDSATAANDIIKQNFETTRNDLAPWREAGVNALARIEAGMAPGGEYTKTFESPEFKFQEDPGYQFRLQEGEKALSRAAAARRMNNSGATYKDLLRFGENLASDEYDRAYNRYDTNRKFDYSRFVGDQASKFNRDASVAGIGQTAVNSLISSGDRTASTVSNNLTQAGNVNAGATIAGVNALTGGVGTALKGYQDAQMLEWLKGRSPTVASGATQ